MFKLEWPNVVISDICNPQFGPLMVRYYLTPKIFGLRLVLHKFLRSDNDRHLHDHPWNFITWIVKGCYFEHQEDGTFFRKRWSLLKRSKFHKHWVELTRKHTFGDFVSTWTLFYGERRQWGFHTKEGWVHNEKYDCRD